MQHKTNGSKTFRRKWRDLLPAKFKTNSSKLGEIKSQLRWYKDIRHTENKHKISKNEGKNNTQDDKK